MTNSYLLNRGAMIFWRRRLPTRTAGIFGRSHLVFSLRTRDPKVARQLSRRLAVFFDEIVEIMEQSTRNPTKEQQQAIIQTFRDLVQERIDLRRAITWTPTADQLRAFREEGPDSQEALQAIIDAEETYLESDPDAKVALEERYAAHAATGGFANLEVLKVKWSDALQRNDTALVAPLMKEALERNSVALSPNSIALAQLTRQALQGGIEILESAISEHKP